jgi:hypothetical protein
MNDVNVGHCLDEIEKDLKTFVEFWNAGDHVMYRKVASDIFYMAQWLLEEVEKLDE